MDKYKYAVELSYIRQKERTSEKITSNHIKSIIIDRDYINNNLPIIFMNLALTKKLIDDMILNFKQNTMVLTIYKYIYRENKLMTKTRYIHSEMVYFLEENLNYRDSLDYADKENQDREDLTKNISIGLMSIDSINNNKKSINAVLKNTTMMNAVNYCTSHMDMIIEKFDYNDELEELLIKPQSSVSNSIKYLNSISVFYKTPYIFFIDFNCGYLLSTSGTSVAKQGESINTILINIQDPLNESAMAEGMKTNYSTQNYQIDISALDTIISQNKITEKVYTAISAISEEGVSDTQSLSINQSKYSDEKTELIRTPSSNPNLIENIAASNNQTSAKITVNKVDVDVSIFTPNKRYIVKNYSGYKDRDGDFILTRKRDLFYLESQDMFVGNAMLELSQVIK